MTEPMKARYRVRRMRRTPRRFKRYDPERRIPVDQLPEKITIQIQDTRSGRLLERALEIMAETGCTMGEAVNRAQFEAENNLLD